MTARALPVYCYAADDVKPVVDGRFYAQTGGILVSALCAGLCANRFIGLPIFDLPLSPIRVLPERASALAKVSLVDVVALTASFCLLTHVRALWHVPQWTKTYNIFVDVLFGVGCLCLSPSAATLTYCWMHTGFFLMHQLDRRRFLGLFSVRERVHHAGRSRHAWRGLYFLATLFEVGVQGIFVLRSTLFVPSL